MLSINCWNVYVEFPIFDVHTRSLRHQLGLGRLASALKDSARKPKVGGRINTSQSGDVTVSALSGIDFRLSEGDRVALIGRNGSGKTTLLRTIAGIYEPTRGSLEVRGRVTPMFSLSFGMDPDSTGTENIWLRGRMLGLSDDTIISTISDVTTFSELGEYLDMPIRTYSAGMRARLAFAVATSVKPEILVLDETIGAVDSEFSHRARDRLERLVERTGILVMASHDSNVLRDWCSKGIVLRNGETEGVMNIEEALQLYAEYLAGDQQLN